MPNLIAQTFHRPRVLLPVVHCLSRRQAIQQARVAAALDADGVFLINQGGLDAEEVASVAGYVADIIPGWFVGVNLLGVTPDTTARLLARRRRQLGGLWDDAVTPSLQGLCPLYFGGVAFKYQQPEVPPSRWAEVARVAAESVGVVTTSGPGTGEAADVEKVQVMRAALGDHALALASGITPANVANYLPYVDAYLVASGIEMRFGEFDLPKLRDLVDRVHAYQPAGQ